MHSYVLGACWDIKVRGEGMIGAIGVSEIYGHTIFLGFTRFNLIGSGFRDTYHTDHTLPTDFYGLIHP